MTSIAQWVAGARPRTLPAAVVPVMVGCALVLGEEGVSGSEIATRGCLALLVSVALQVAVNYANDYSDGIRGTDNERVGPQRLVASGLSSASAVKRAALLAFVVGAIAGGVLALLTTWWLIPIGMICMVAGWTYTGGPKPYGYAGLGELFVFVFFGLVATTGTAFVITEQVSVLALVSGVVVGALAVALLVVNNIRDIDNDRVNRKMTLAVRIGAQRARRLYASLYVLAGVAMIAAAFIERLALIGLVGLLAALPAVSTVRTARSAPQLIEALGMTARAQLVIGGLYALGLAIQ
jgi:1,4-dihydroxy-2-naphthoate octaprenyltransferase